MPRRVRDAIKQRAKNFIREWRDHRRFTQQQLAAQIGTTAASISRIETNEQPYTQDTLEVIAKVLRTTPAALISRKPGEDDQALWLLLQRASAVERRQIEKIARVLVETNANSPRCL